MLFRDGILLFNQAGALPPRPSATSSSRPRDLDMDEVRRQAGAGQSRQPRPARSASTTSRPHTPVARSCWTSARTTSSTAGHVPGAVHMPMNELPTRVSELPTDQPVFVICAVGGRSRQVVDHLRAQGINAFNVSDGTSGWTQRGWPLER